MSSEQIVFNPHSLEDMIALHVLFDNLPILWYYTVIIHGR